MIVRTVIFSFLFLLSCSQKQTLTEHDILVLGHIYQWHTEGNKIDERLENKEYAAFKELWLLGDLCSETTREQATLEYLDEIFDLSSNSTKWAVGNHDIRNGNLDYISNTTGRPLYYGSIEDNLAIYVLNSQMQHYLFKDSCAYKQLQDQDFRSFLDKISKDNDIKHLFVLSHNPIWSDAEESLREYELIGNAQAGWIDMICEWNGEFRNQYLETLIEIQRKGVEVHCVSGDGGQYQKSFYETAESGINYYVTGINNSYVTGINEANYTVSGSQLKDGFNTNPDSILVFDYDTASKRYLHKFIPVENLR